MKKNVVAIMGPTAVGKTKLSIELAKRFNGEIISGDSMQVYKGLDIGTAKIKQAEMQGIPHHMLDIREPDEDFSAADFKELVQQYIAEITARGKLPIIVGGSGLYIQAALYDYNFSDRKRDPLLTKEMEEIVKLEGIMPLYQRLEQIDPEQAKKIHPNNHRRVIRALEIYETTGMTMSEYEKNQVMESPYNPILLGLEMPRALLYERINDRVDQMIEKGLKTEVKKVYDEGYASCQSMKAIGYKEWISYFKGEQSLEGTVELLKRNSRRYAKRQYTWFKNKMDVTWYSVTPSTIDEDFTLIFEELAGILKK
ncbi:tRNA (adenosine(37)-N6)-dimethylallyltransferase MiaA [Oceanobacillus profundus]|uniref:tRNA (adenosine(37)-N6)-dimethylallyltransferase MiaA n=1 Tax=Oceanobacillus profundus TaxID=372463 RepID=UPI000BA6D5D6|nr:tRNA (adenosine(37)-N6)-dimethylallyltransferase MiaA [Oceanobacillus profundus]MBR3121499.1 tRNA (adenosine(37)-N6)-dimethylallyltransferase MiaA [Oceanobacillus sp.]MCM3396433.1 tRNA (adenosine(37)-N6)-dimethylallyltransferase MiaA [Oceanobacillus profundus]PAE29904.1 tRNA (adenosine(37)-N6)-dimethylallyltransferase MiaA [Paenibacillus sp. 7884-2]